MTERFSDDHPFTRLQVEDAAHAVANEANARGLLIRVTTGFRSLALRQFVANQLAFICAIPLIFFTAFWEQVIDRDLLMIWLAIAVGSWLVRLAVYYRVFTAPPSKVATSIPLRLIPLGMISMSTVFWMWSITILIGPMFTATAAALLLGLIALSVAMIGMWPTTPGAAASQITLVWATVAYEVISEGIAPWPLMIAALGMMAFTLWAVVYVSVRQVNTHLERTDRVDLLVAELRDANAQLETLKTELWNQLSKRSAFFAGASHDFRQRIHAFKLLAASASKALGGHPSALLPLARLVQQLNDMEVYITHVLDFARMEAVDTAPQLSDVQLHRIFQRLDVQFTPVAEAEGVDLKLIASGAVLRTDGAMLQRILENLVSNALKFTRKRVLVAARRRAGGLAIEVWDQGPGLDEEQRGRIFEAFYQNENRPSRQRGVGLGLAIVRRLTDSMGYHVDVQSQPGRGSVFRLLLPASAIATTIKREGEQ